MPTDYIVFIHGVNTRQGDIFYDQAQRTFDNINANITPNPARNLKPVVLFWGNIAAQSTNALEWQLSQDSAAWQKIWFKDLRLKQVLPFVGDAALYLSRTVSVNILNQLIDQAVRQIGLNAEEARGQLPMERDNGDRLHLVTHSWGTVILFDILFATRWEESDLREEIRTSVEKLRSYFFGVASNSENQQSKNAGIPIASLHTMGSPIALFNLINASNTGTTLTFDLTPKLKEFLQSSAQLAGRQLPWQNFIHPGDPIAYPLQGAMRASLEEAGQFVQIADIVTKAKLSAQLLNVFSLGIIAGGEAHGSYWNNLDVAKDIAQVIQSTFP